MRLSIVCAALVLAASTMGASASASASEIYQWTDARGVTHYSETPPPAGTPYQTRRITNAGATAQAAVAAPVPAADENPQCATARGNIELLVGEGPVHQDDGSGNSRELTEDERTNQLELARAAVRAYCTDADA